MTRLQDLQAALRTEVQRLYESGCDADPSELPAMVALAEHVSIQEGRVDVFDVLRWAISKVGRGRHDKRDLAAATTALLGVDATRGMGYGRRWREVAPILGYSSGDSFRHSREHGRKRIDVLLDRLTNRLVELADESGFTYIAPDVPDTVSSAPAKKYLSIEEATYRRYPDGAIVKYEKGPTDPGVRQVLREKQAMRKNTLYYE